MTGRKTFYIYILSNKHNTVLYTGMTNDLIRMVYEHKNKLIEGFTKRYNITKLLYYELTESVESAILREKQVKDYRRDKKFEMVRQMNPEMRDLYSKLVM